MQLNLAQTGRLWLHMKLVNETHDLNDISQAANKFRKATESIEDSTSYLRQNPEKSANLDDSKLTKAQTIECQRLKRTGIRMGDTILRNYRRKKTKEKLIQCFCNSMIQCSCFCYLNYAWFCYMERNLLRFCESKQLVMMLWWHTWPIWCELSRACLHTAQDAAHNAIIPKFYRNNSPERRHYNTWQ